MIHTVAVENKLDGDAPSLYFFFSRRIQKALEFAHDIDKTIEMADASDRYKVFVDSAYPDKTNGLDWLYDDLGDRINAKAYKSARTDKDKAN